MSLQPSKARDLARFCSWISGDNQGTSGQCGCFNATRGFSRCVCFDIVAQVKRTLPQHSAQQKKTKINDLDKMWSILSQEEKQYLLIQRKPTQQTSPKSTLQHLGKDILRCLAPFLANDGTAWSCLLRSCSYFAQILPTFFEVLNLHNKGRECINWTYYVKRFIFRAEARLGINLQIFAKCKADENCRFINFTDSFKIDKYTGLILNRTGTMPRGYVHDLSPELFLSPENNGCLVPMFDMEKKFRDFKRKRQQMESHLIATMQEIKTLDHKERKTRMSFAWDGCKMKSKFLVFLPFQTKRTLSRSEVSEH